MTSTIRSTVGQPVRQTWTGIYAGVVHNINDPLHKSRLQALVPQVMGKAVSNWAIPVAMLPSTLNGIVPPVGTVVHISFIGGDINRPAWAATTAHVTPPAPTSWQPLTLTGGWSNVSGKAAAQYRPSGSDGIEIIGNISGGTVTDGTTIATLPSGSIPISGHSFNVDAVTGAAAAPITVTTTTTTSTSSSFSGGGNLSNTTVEASPPAGSVGPYSGSVSLADLNDLAAYATALGSLVNNGLFVANPTTVDSGTVSSSSSSSSASSASANFDSPTMTVDTSGNLKITNVNSHVTALSFHHTISLTA